MPLSTAADCSVYAMLLKPFAEATRTAIPASAPKVIAAFLLECLPGFHGVV